MALVLDNFDRPDNPTTLGIATSGQTWQAGIGGDFGSIVGHQAVPTGSSDVLTVIEAGNNNTVVQVTIMNADAGGIGLRNQGVVARFADSTHYMFLTFSRAAGGFRFYVADDWNGGTATHVGPDNTIDLQDGDTIALANCGQKASAFHNGVLIWTVDFVNDIFHPQSAALLNATQYGLQADNTQAIFDNFSVVLNDDCHTWDCTEGGCVDPGTGLGAFSSLTACLISCGISPSYDCVDGVCCDPGDGSGEFPTLEQCQNSGCGMTFQVDTFRFNAGAEPVDYYAAWQLTEGGAPKQDKEIRAIQVTGKNTDAEALVYGYSQTEPIPIQDIEDGINSLSGSIPLGSVTEPTTLERVELNISNAGLFTVRVGGTWDGLNEPDRIDKVEVEFQPLGMPR